jgi:hypothetical protein
VNATLATSLGGLGANVSAVGAGEILYSTGATTYDSLAAGNSGECLTSSGAGAPVWTSCAGATGIVTYWNLANGALSAKNSTVDFLLGGISSDSAKFAILGVNNARGQQTASISGNLVLDAAGSLTTTLNQTLTIGGGSTGNIIIDSGSGLVTISDNTTVAGGVNLTSGNAFSINGTSVLNSTTLGAGITASSLTSVGTLTSGTWNATAIGSQYGG